MSIEMKTNSESKVFNLEWLSLTLRIENDTLLAECPELDIGFFADFRIPMHISDIATVKFRNLTCACVDVILVDGRKLPLLSNRYYTHSVAANELAKNFEKKNAMVQFFTYNSYLDKQVKLLKKVEEDLKSDADKIKTHALKQLMQQHSKLRELREDYKVIKAEIAALKANSDS